LRSKGKMAADTKLFVKKNREYGSEGVVNFYFNENTRQFRTEKGD